MRSDILGTLADIDAGAVVEHATQSLGAVVAQVRKTGAEGTVTLKLTIAREDSAAGTVRVECAVSAKVTTDWSPDEKARATMMFVDEDGCLVLENPRQGKLAMDGETMVSLTLPDGTKTKPVTVATMKAAVDTVIAKRLATGE